MHKDQLTASDWVAIGILAGVGFTALIYVPFGWVGIGKALRSEVTAAWLQAVGSLFALGLAIWIPSRTRKLEEEQRRRNAEERAIITAIKLNLQLRGVSGFVEMCIAAIVRYEEKGQPVNIHDIEAFLNHTEFPSDDHVFAINHVDPLLGARITMAIAGLQHVTAMVRHHKSYSSIESFTRVFSESKGLLEPIHSQLKDVIQKLRAYNRGRLANN